MAALGCCILAFVGRVLKQEDLEHDTNLGYIVKLYYTNTGENFIVSEPDLITY